MVEQHFTVQDLCTIFGNVDKKTIYRWIEENKFPNAVKIRDGYYVPERDVQALLEASRINPSHRPKRKILSPGVDG